MIDLVLTFPWGIIAQWFTTIAVLTALFEIRRVHHGMNSRMDQLLKTSGAAEFAAGAKEERNRGEERDRKE